MVNLNWGIGGRKNAGVIDSWRLHGTEGSMLTPELSRPLTIFPYNHIYLFNEVKLSLPMGIQ